MSARSIRLGFALVVLALPGLSKAAPLDCTVTPADPPAPSFTVEMLSPEPGGTTTDCSVTVVGRAELESRPPLDVYVIVDSSGSTAGASGIDVDGDGVVGEGDWRTNDQPGDSTLAAELEAVRRALEAWAELDVRVALLEYSAVIPIPPGEPNEQGRIRTVQGLTADHELVRAGLETIRAAGSNGATDYGGALLELAAEYDRSGDPSRRPVAFFLSDGKPTFPRFPFDSTESPDVEWALEGAAAVAARGLPVNTLEIGTFDDLAVLEQVSDITGGRLFPGLSGGELLDALATFSLDGFAAVRLENVTTGEATWATTGAAGEFVAELPLRSGPNELEVRLVLRDDAGTEWTITCPVSLTAWCLDGDGLDGGRDGWVGVRDGTRGGGGGGGGGGSDRGSFGGDGGLRPGRVPDDEELRRRAIRNRPQPPILHPWTADRIGEWTDHPCIPLGGDPGLGDDCNEALRQLTALLISIEEGELTESCALDPDVLPDHATVGELIEALEFALSRGARNRCRDAAAAAAVVTGGDGLAEQPVGPTPTGRTDVECTTVLDGTDVEVVVEITSPAGGTVVGEGEDCGAIVRVEGDASAAGDGAYDVYFVVDSSGSTAGSSGRDLDGDGDPETTLEAELEAVRQFVDLLDPATVRVALIEFSAILPIPPGEPAEQGRIRTVQSLTSDFDAFRSALDSVLAAGSVGATDYGGALTELAAEYDRNGDPSRGSVAFFLSDGKPTFPRFPYDSTEVIDVDHAIDGALACADRGITVNTYEVGVFDDLSVLLDVAATTGGAFYGELADGAVVDALPGSSLVGIEDVSVENRVTGIIIDADLAPDGSWSAPVAVAPGENEIVVRIVSSGGEEIVECVLPLVGECTWPDCLARSPEHWLEQDCR